MMNSSDDSHPAYNIPSYSYPDNMEVLREIGVMAIARGSGTQCTDPNILL